MSTILDVFRDNVTRLAERPAMRHRRGDGPWNVITWAEYGRLVDELAAGLTSQGIRPGDRVGLLSQNRVEWHLADIAIMSVGAVTVPIYPTSAPTQVRYVVDHSGMRACFVENAEQLAKITEQGPAVGALERVMTFEGADVRLDDPFVTSIDILRSVGRDALRRDPTVVRDRSSTVRPDGLATIVYTSGTTGPPKGVLLTHQNITATIDSIRAVVAIGPEDRFLSFLPLSHIAERVVSNFGHIAAGGETWFARSFASVAHDLLECRPTLFVAVPRVWEKFRDAISAELRGTDRARKLVIGQYRKVAGTVAGARATATTAPLVDRIQFEALDRVVGASVRRKIGLDKARLLVSTAAPIDAQLLHWLATVGLRVSEVYGQTEACGPTTLTPPGRERFGTVGPPLPGVEVRIASDDEILVRGPNICGGYYRDDAGTNALLDGDGWMLTGDMGFLDERGYLRITGRKKDLIKTAHGKYVAPQDIETRLGSQLFVSHAIVVGEGKPFVSALFTLDVDAIAPWARERGKRLDLEALAWDPDVHEIIEKGVHKVNQDLNHVEQIKRWHILPRELTIDAGELTPTMKVVRAAVFNHFSDAVNELYAGGSLPAR